MRVLTRSKRMVKKEKKLPKVWRDAAAHREANGGALVPAPDNPYCIKCGLCNHRAKNFLEPQGADDPWITVVFDGVSWKEDDANEVATEGSRNGQNRCKLKTWSCRAYSLRVGLVA